MNQQEERKKKRQLIAMRSRQATDELSKQKTIFNFFEQEDGNKIHPIVLDEDGNKTPSHCIR